MAAAQVAQSTRPGLDSQGCLADNLSLLQHRVRGASSDFVFAKCSVFWSYRGQIGVDLRAKRASFAAFKKRLSFVFKYFLASFPLFSIFCSSLHSPTPELLCFSSRSEACLRQCVHKMTTTIGYHRPRGLSSEKCGKTGSADILPERCRVRACPTLVGTNENAGTASRPPRPSRYRPTEDSL